MKPLSNLPLAERGIIEDFGEESLQLYNLFLLYVNLGLKYVSSSIHGDAKKMAASRIKGETQIYILLQNRSDSDHFNDLFLKSLC